MLGKLRTRLLDESFHAGLLLRSWHKAGLLPELGEMAQCLKEGDAATAAKARQTKLHLTNKDITPRKKVRLDAGTSSSDSNRS